MKKTIIWIIELMLIISLVTAFGIGPSQYIVDFTPNHQENTHFTIYNKQAENLTFTITQITDLKGTTKTNLKEIKLTPNTTEAKIPYTITLPKDLPPGEYITKIQIREQPKTTNGITAVRKLSHKIIIKVPKHGKYIATNTATKDRQLTLNITNIGIKDIDELQAHFRLLEQKQIVLNQDKNLGSLNSDERKSTTFKLDNIPQGEYNANIKIQYDEAAKNISMPVAIGEPKLTIQEFKWIKGLPGTISQFNLVVQSNWNRPIEAQTRVIIRDGDAVLIDEETPVLNFKAKSSSSHPIYIDTSNLPYSNLTASIEIDYLGKEEKIEFKQEVTKEGIKTIDIKEPIDAKGDILFWASITICIIIILFFVFVILRLKYKINNLEKNFEQREKNFENRIKYKEKSGNVLKKYRNL